MRNLTSSPKRFLLLLLGLGFIWCLAFPYFILFQGNTDQMGVIERDLNILKKDGREWMENSKGKEIIKSVFQFVDDLLGIIKPSDLEQYSPPPQLKDYKDFVALQIQMNAERDKGQIRENMIKELLSDKLRLQQQVVNLEELLKLQAQKGKTDKQVKSDDQVIDDNNCPLPPMDGFPHCQEKIKWMKEMWKTDPCYASYGVNGTLCSILIYLSETESWCPLLPGHVKPAAPLANLEADSKHAEIRDSLTGLYLHLENRAQYKWIHQRIRSMEEIWVEAGRSLSAKYNLTGREAKQILVHPGVVTAESQLKITETAFSGGPLGELVQWSDLISTLHILGHHLYLSASIKDLKDYLRLPSNCPARNQKIEPKLIYTDIVGLLQIKKVAAWINYQCTFRVLDSFGTEPDFNHAQWAKSHNTQSTFGGLNLIPTQFYTMFPHTPDNTFLGFVVQHQLRTNESKQLQSTTRRNQALVYGKNAKFWEGKEAYLDIIHNYFEIHATVDGSAPIPGYVNNHGIITGTEVQTLLRQSKVFVGLSFPYEGPAPLEALANGCAFLNPRLHPPLSSLNSEFFKGKPNTREVTSQHPYAEAIGQPYVWTVDMHNTTDVERALSAILNQTTEPYLPYEFTCEGMLQRLNILIEKQDFCDKPGNWPPLSALQVFTATPGTSCKKACQDKGLICEPAFFPHINNARKLAEFNIDCQTSERSENNLVYPAYRDKYSSKHCVLQSDPLLFSCVRSDSSLVRICPCRDYIKDQIALCKACV